MENKRKQKADVVVMIDDDRVDREIIKAALLSQDYPLRLEVFGSAIEAVDYLEKCIFDPKSNPLPKLVLLDLNMPGMDGKEFLRTVKRDKILCTIPVIIVSSSDYNEDVRGCYELQAAGYIHKASMPGQFRDIFEKLIKYWFETSESRMIGSSTE
ncbi:MAG: response regulator [Anaerohalosphaeraceae bacterium]|nr:response regulator [Anaerohalosphaeraceae bacterium]